ncbi:hypothetical protein BS47DRAFT_611960 [Hydnum rufescens UP504]|uniref:ARID domain-containing protein n=1 Tax=Hydnum rufescens UP504 TaxID=1448309 RepID=A0A9P6B364_9AGAM|nr:hypothetical protein BS47DRAFT_611960 [Hydnum rufescens UP504]
MQQMQPPVSNQFTVPSSPSVQDPTQYDAQFRPLQAAVEPETAAKQMAALSAANPANRKRALNSQPPPGNAISSRPGTSSGLPPNLVSHQGPPVNPLARPPNAGRQQFLKMLNDIMAQTGFPLPPTLTGLPNPSFDPVKSRFAQLDIPGEGFVRLAGKAVDLHELFMTVAQRFGGSAKITQAKQWGALSAQLGLPEMTSAPNNPNPMPVASILQQYYGAVLGLLEEWYLKQQHQKQLRSQQAVPDGSSSFLPPGAQPGPSRMAVGPGEAYGVDGGIRRKIPESLPEKREEAATVYQPPREIKPPSSPPIMPTDARETILPEDPLPSPSHRRFKIEYVPVSRPLDSYGGRRLDAIDQQLSKVQERRVVRHFDELGALERSTVTHWPQLTRSSWS